MEKSVLFTALRERYAQLRNERDEKVREITDVYDVRLKGLEQELKILHDEIYGENPEAEELQGYEAPEPVEPAFDDHPTNAPNIVPGTWACEHSTLGVCAFDVNNDPEMTVCVWKEKCDRIRAQRGQQTGAVQQAMQPGGGPIQPVQPEISPIKRKVRRKKAA